MIQLTAANTPRIRTLKACNQCRQRKVKCDGTAQCLNCTKYSVPCVYDSVPSKRVGRKKGVKSLKKKNNKVVKVESSKKLNSSSIDIEKQIAPTAKSTRAAIRLANISKNIENEKNANQAVKERHPEIQENKALSEPQQKESLTIFLPTASGSASFISESVLAESISKICQSIDAISEKHGIPALKQISNDVLSVRAADGTELSINDKLNSLMNSGIPMLLQQVDSVLDDNNIFGGSPITSSSSMNTYYDQQKQESVTVENDDSQKMLMDGIQSAVESPSQTTNYTSVSNNSMTDTFDSSIFVRNDINNGNANNSNNESMFLDTDFSNISMFFNSELSMDLGESLMIS